MKFEDGLAKSAAERNIPFSGAFELTPRCNFHCRMCYVNRPLNDAEAIRRELPAETWIRLAKEARNAGLLELTLTGGEVLARPDFEEIYRELCRMGFLLTVYTNGSLITPHIADLFGELRPSAVSITLYGASEDTYQRVTGCKSGFRRAVEGIDMLMARGIKVQLKTTVIRDNAPEFDRIEKIASERGLTLPIVNYIAPRREGNRSDPVGNRLSPKELAGYELHAWKVFRERVDRIGPPQAHAEEDDDHHCLAGKCLFWATWDGRLTPCGMLGEPSCSLLEEDFSAAWQQLNQKFREIPDCGECADCGDRAYCNSCPARRYLETGSYTSKAAYLCECAAERRNLGMVR